MYANTIVRTARVLVGLAAAACTLSPGSALANDHLVNIELHVRTDGLDLRRAADVTTLYARIKQVAWVACTHAGRVGLVPLDNPSLCYEDALGRAIGSIKLPTLTQMYLATHTPQQAARCGVEVPVQIAGR